MADVYTSEHEDFRKTARTFYEREVVPLHDQWEKDGIVPRELWLKAGEAGLLCFDVPEEYGGPGVDDFRYNVIALRGADPVGATAPASRSTPTSSSPTSPASGPTSRSGAGCPGCVYGETITAIAMTEPGAGSDLQGVRTTAVDDGDHYVLNGPRPSSATASTPTWSSSSRGPTPTPATRASACWSSSAAWRASSAAATSTRSACTPRTPPSSPSPTSRCRRRTCSARRARASST